MVQEKNIVTNIILSIVTCGIYGIIWFINITDDVKKVSNDEQLQSGGIAFLLTLVTCGIYGYFWAYKMGKALNQAKINNGMPEDDKSAVYLILQIFGLGIVNWALMQNDLNEFANKNANIA